MLRPSPTLWRYVAATDPATTASIDSGFMRKYDYDEDDYEVDEDMIIGYWRVVERD